MLQVRFNLPLNRKHHFGPRGWILRRGALNGHRGLADRPGGGIIHQTARGGAETERWWIATLGPADTPGFDRHSITLDQGYHPGFILRRVGDVWVISKGCTDGELGETIASHVTRAGDCMAQIIALVISEDLDSNSLVLEKDDIPHQSGCAIDQIGKSHIIHIRLISVSVLILGFRRDSRNFTRQDVIQSIAINIPGGY